ncbi:MAG: hypothetical protein AB2L14_26625 [Candidatus Xenobiia bacterium LiM19]
MESIRSTLPPISITEIALKGLQKVKTARDEEKDATCDFFLRQVEKQGNETEKLLAHGALTQIPGEKGSVSGASLGFKIAILDSITKGVSGPVGMAVAQVVIDGAAKSYSARMARTYVESLAEHGNDYEREILSRSLALSDNASEYEQQSGDLKLLEMTSKGLPLSPAVALAEVGLGMIAGSQGNAYGIGSAAVGARFLHAAAEKGTERDKSIARTILEPFSELKPYKWNNNSLKHQWDGAFTAINRALVTIATNSVPLSPALIDLGLTLQMPYRLSILDTLSKDSANPVLSVVSGTLKEAITAIPHEHERTEIAYPAFQELQNSTASTVDTALVRQALKARETMRMSINKEKFRARIGNVFLKAIAGHATMPENSRVAREALDACAPKGLFERLFSRKSSAEIVGIQSQAFNSIIDNLKTKELEAELQREIEMERSVAERVLDAGGSSSPGNHGTVQDGERFIEVDGIKLSKKQLDYMR